MTDKEVMHMALDALVSSTGELHLRLASQTDMQLVKNHKAIQALRTAIAQPEHVHSNDISEEHVDKTDKNEHEPVVLQDDEIYDAAFSAYCKGENSRELFRIMWGNRLTCSIGWDREELKSFARNIAALYIAPPQREWQGLTDEEVVNRANAEVFAEAFARGVAWAELKLKEKNT